MNRKFIRDLQAWEAGDLSVSVLSARYPAEEVGRLTSLFSEMGSLSSEPAPNPNRGWNMVRTRMAAHIEREPMPLMQRLRPGIQRRLAFGMAAAILVVPPMAFAASNQDAVDSLVGDITVSIFGAAQQSATGETVIGELPDSINDDKFSSDGVGSGQSVGAVPGGKISRESQAAVSGQNGSTAAQTGPNTNGAAAGTGIASKSGSSGTSGASGKESDGSDSTSADGADSSSADAVSTTASAGSDALGSQGTTSPSSPNTASTAVKSAP
ncbi:MAG: hypothetical protein ACR2FO_07905 [Actinomycetota bacterium]